MFDNNTLQSTSQQLINFHDPYIRLHLRSKIQDIISTNNHINNILSGFDSFAILDAVLKRGNIEQAQLKLQQIQLSLPYYNNLIIKHAIYQINKLPQHILTQLSKYITRIQQQQIIQQHLLPITTSNSYYTLNQQQNNFMYKYYSNIDQYLCIKTLAYFGADVDKIQTRYVNKYYLLRRWLYVHDYIVDLQNTQLNMLKLNTTSKICIIGLNIANIILAIKLYKLGIYTKIYDNSLENINKWKNGYIPDLLQQGIYLNNQVENNRISNILLHYLGLSVQEQSQSITAINGSNIQNIPPISQFTTNTNPSSPDPLKKYQQIYLTLFQQILRQYPSNLTKIFWQQLQHKAITYNNIQKNNRNRTQQKQKIDIQQLHVYNERIIIMNKLGKQSQITVQKMRKFVYQQLGISGLNNNNITNNLNTLLSTNKLYMISTPTNKQKHKQLFQQQQSPINTNNILKYFIYNKQYNNWQIYANKQQCQKFNYIIYSNLNNVQECIDKGNSKFKDMKQIQKTVQNSMGQYKQEQKQNIQDKIAAGLLSQVRIYGQVHCLYKFNQRVIFKDVISDKYDNSLMYTYSYSTFGFVHFYIVKDGMHVYANLIKNSKDNATIDYYKQIQTMLINNILKKGIKIQNPLQYWNKCIQLCKYAIVKDQNITTRIIKYKQKQNLYLSIPIIKSINSSNILSSHLQINNKILTNILQKIANKNNNISQSITQSKSISSTNNNKKKDCIFNRMSIQKYNIQNKQKTQDLFGFAHPFVKQYCQYLQITKQQITNTIENIIKSVNKTICTILPNFPNNLLLKNPKDLNSPGIIYTNLNFCIPYKQNNKNHILHYKSIRLGQSLSNKNKISFFYQTSIKYQNKPIYFIIQLQSQSQHGNKNYTNLYNNQAIVLFHTDYQILNQSVCKYMRKFTIAAHVQQQQQINYDYYFFTQQLFQYVETKLRQLQKNSNIKRNKIQLQSQCTKILNITLQNLQNYFTHSATTLAKWIIPSKTISQQVQYIYNQANLYALYFCNLYGLRKYNICDIFLGKLNIGYINAQILGFTSAMIDQNISQQKTQIPKFLQKIYYKTNSKSPYSFKIQLQNNKKINIYRRFFPFRSTNNSTSEYWCYPTTLQQFTPYPYSQTSNLFTNQPNKFIKSILTTLIQSNLFSIQNITTQLLLLIRYQIQQIIQLINLYTSTKQYQQQIFIYFKMTRMKLINKNKNTNNNMESMEIINKLYQMSDTNSQSVRNNNSQKIGDMIDEGDIILFGNQFVICK